MKFVGYTFESNDAGDLFLGKISEPLIQATKIRVGDCFTLQKTTTGELKLVNWNSNEEDERYD